MAFNPVLGSANGVSSETDQPERHEGTKKKEW